MDIMMLGLAMVGGPAGGAGPGEGQQSPLYMVGWIVIMIGIFYFMMIRPQQKRAKERQNLLGAIKSGDRVVFGGGVLGVVTNVKEKTMLIKISDNVKVEVVRSAVTQVLDKGQEPEAETAGQPAGR